MRNKSWSHEELITFSRKLGQLLDVGVGLLTALEVIERTCSKRMKGKIKMISGQLELGKPLSLGLQKAHFPPFYCFIMLAAEQHGSYSGALSILLQYYEQRKERWTKHKKILTYPLLVFLTCFLTFLFFIHGLIPQMVTLYGSFSVELPWITHLLLFLAQEWKTVYFILLMVLSLSLLIFGYLLKKHRLLVEKLLLTIPFLSLNIKTYLTAMNMKQMGYLLDSGISVLQICDLFSKESHWEIVRHSFIQVKQSLLDGISLSQSLQQIPFLHVLAMETVIILEKTGNLGVGFIQLANELEKEHNHQLELFMNLFEVQTTIGAGIFVFLIMLALFLPMFDFIQHF